MSKKEKFKKFVEEHKVGIAYLAGAAGAFVGCMIGCKLSDNKILKYRTTFKTEQIKRVLESVEEFNNIDLFTSIIDTPIKASELGELGKKMMEVGVTDKYDFTHFIAIGESK